MSARDPIGSDGGASATVRLLAVCANVRLPAFGTWIVIRRLLEHFSEREIRLLGRKPVTRTAAAAGVGTGHPTAPVPWVSEDLRGERYWNLLSVLPLVVRGWFTVRRDRPEALLAFYPDESTLLAGYLLHRLTGVPLIPYLCDLYLEEKSGWQRRLARWLQPRVFRDAARVVVVNRGMAEYYQQRYGIDAVPIPTCINVEIPGPAVLPPVQPPFVVGYSGNVNEARLSTLRMLVSAIGDNPDYEIRYFTRTSEERLRALGLFPSNASRAYFDSERDLVGALGGCDALYLPLTFEVGENSYEQLATCFGVKSYEYFLSQRPILLQAPGEYFISRFYREAACGLVVDEPTVDALLEALDRLRRDADLRTRLAHNALATARQFRGGPIAATLRETVRAAVGRGARDA